MWKDGVVEEVREARRKHAEAHGYDLPRIHEDLKEQERRAGTPVVHLPPRPRDCEARSLPRVDAGLDLGVFRTAPRMLLSLRSWTPPGTEVRLKSRATITKSASRTRWIQGQTVAGRSPRRGPRSHSPGS